MYQIYKVKLNINIKSCNFDIDLNKAGYTGQDGAPGVINS